MISIEQLFSAELSFWENAFRKKHTPKVFCDIYISWWDSLKERTYLGFRLLGERIWSTYLLKHLLILLQKGDKKDKMSNLKICSLKLGQGEDKIAFVDG